MVPQSVRYHRLPPPYERYGLPTARPGYMACWVEGLFYVGQWPMRTKLDNDIVQGTTVIITINVPVVYMARDVRILMRAISITWGIGRGGP
jgi:hypothetical protein